MTAGKQVRFRDFIENSKNTVVTHTVVIFHIKTYVYVISPHNLAPSLSSKAGTENLLLQ